MLTALPIRAVIASPFQHITLNRRIFFGGGLLYVFKNPSEWKHAVTMAAVFFVASLALAPALMTDQKKLAAEINSKTLKAAAAIKSAR